VTEETTARKVWFTYGRLLYFKVMKMCRQRLGEKVCQHFVSGTVTPFDKLMTMCFRHALNTRGGEAYFS